LIVDTHIDVPYRLETGGEDVSVATAGGDFDHPRAVAGGLDAPFMSIFIPAAVDAAGDAGELADRLIARVERVAAENPDKFVIATCSADLAAAHQRQRIALAMGLENGAPIAGELANLTRYFDLGVRYVTLTHGKANHIADSSYDTERPWGGLSPFGERLIAAMNEAGMIIDVSHISDEAFWRVLALSRVPVLATHSSLRHFTSGFERNMSDEMVTALGRQGGVIQINFGSGFLTQTARDWSSSMQEAVTGWRTQAGVTGEDPRLAEFVATWVADHPYPFATLDDVLDHIDRAVELAGIDAVGIGSDYDGVGNTLPRGLEDVSRYPNLVAGLRERGYTDAEIAKILGENTLRVWRANEAFAAAAGHAPRCRVAAAAGTSAAQR
jgi:membrane dipeptidase